MPEHRGFVPPGLVSKGGMPPGQAKKWRIGQALPREVVFYDLPRPLEIHLGPPPSGYRYVRVATDILLIAVGTGIVMGGSMGELGPFSGQVSFTAPSSKYATIILRTYSAKDGSVVEAAAIRVKYAK